MLDTTVIIPTKDRKKMLLRSVLSISEQTTLPKKVIIVDDASKEPVRKSWFSSCENLQIEVIRNEESIGGSLSRNLGVSMAETAFISFLDDDDSWESSYLNEISIVLDSLDEDRVALYASKKFVRSDSLDVCRRELIVNSELTLEQLLEGNKVGTTSSVTVSKNILSKVLGFDGSLKAFQDYDCWLRILIEVQNVTFLPVPEAFVVYTINAKGDQISGDYSNHISSRENLIDKYSKCLSSKQIVRLIGSIEFSVAKAIHRKSYWGSLSYSWRAIKSGRYKAILLFLPYRIYSLLGLFTS